MKFYHGGASEPILEKIKTIAPSFEHGNGWTPGKNGKLYDRPERPYFLDNGAFTSSFCEEDWIQALEKISNFESSSDFVVLPDVFDDPKATWERHQKYAPTVEKFGFNHYYVAQKGSRPVEVVEKAVDLGCSGIFIGGSWHKPRILPGFLKEANKQDLKVHIGMPKDLIWASKSGADSMDTVSIARNRSWDRLRRVERAFRSQTKLINY
jgi:hypothetical protein